MPDERMRRLEHQWRSGDDPDAGARVFIERLRAGTLREADLRLAAFLGQQEAALAANGLGLTLPEEADAEYGRWLRVIERGWGLQAAVRAAAAVARDAQRRSGLDDPRLSGLVRAINAWCDDPSIGHFTSVKGLYEQCRQEPRWEPGPSPEAWAAGPTITAAKAVVENTAFWASSAADIEWTWVGDEPMEERGQILRNLVREDLIAWALKPPPERQPPRSELQQRVVAGLVSGGQVMLAAHLGCADAMAAVGPGAVADEPDLARWYLHLLRWPDETILRAASSTLRLALPFTVPVKDDLLRRASRDLADLAASFWSGRAMVATLAHLRPLVELARATPASQRSIILLFQHALTLPWFIDPFRSVEDDDPEAELVLYSWSGTTGVDIGSEVFLRVDGADGSPVWRVQFDGEEGLTKDEVLSRVTLRLVDAALASGLTPASIRTAVRDDVGAWALSDVRREDAL